MTLRRRGNDRKRTLSFDGDAFGQVEGVVGGASLAVAPLVA